MKPGALPARQPGRGLEVAVLAAAITGLLLGAPALGLLRDLACWAETGKVGQRVCPFEQRTGIPCMGCGGTRAFARMARGDLAAAFRANRLGACFGLLGWLVAAGALVSLVSGRRKALVAALVASAALVPVAFVWNAVAWWRSLPPGFRIPY